MTHTPTLGRAGGLAKSAAKRRAARINGSAPPAPGKRRGRPPVPRCPVCGGRMPHRESAARFAAGQEQLRSSMDEVAKLLRHSADGIERMADGMRYDEPRGVRHAIDVHVNLLRDLADELARPGQTKYSPNP